MTIEDDIEFLERVPALRLLGRDALRIIAIGAEARHIHEGISLFGEGEFADAAYVVQHGSFELASEKNTSIEPTVAGPGTLIGELALLIDTNRPVTAVARETSVVIRIPRQLFLKMLEGYPAAADRMRDALAQRLNRTISEITHLRGTFAAEPARE